MAQSIVVTGTRTAKQEELGGLKLYRLPNRVMVASRSQKQVAFLSRHDVPLRAVYVSDLFGDDAGEPRLVLRATNTAAAAWACPCRRGRSRCSRAPATDRC